MTAAPRPPDPADPPLAGIRVLDLTRILAGPFASMALADLGADVVKVEQPGSGDDTRGWGPPFVQGVSTYFYAVNRGKRSLTLDLKHARGKEVLSRLIARSDVVCENFRPGTLDRLGFGWEDLRQLKPSIIYCSISGYGHTSAFADHPSYDLLIQGEAGLMELTGDPAHPPTKCGISIADEIAGMLAVQGILAALLRRERTGEGERIDIGLFDGLLSLLTYQGQMLLSAGKEPSRLGNCHPSITPYETFRAADGRFVNVAVGNEHFWKEFARAIGREDLLRDPRFETNAARVANRASLRPLLDRAFLEHPADHWYDSFSRAGVPVGRIRTVSEALAAAESDPRGMIRTIDDPASGPTRVVGSPLVLGSQDRRPLAAPPRLGEHTSAVLEELGYGAEEIRALRAAGAV